MDKKRIEIIATGVLAAVFLLVLINSFKTVSKKIKAGSGPAVAGSQSASLASVVQGGAPVPDKKLAGEESIDWLRCPFSGKIFASAVNKSFKLKLTGILWDEKMPQALISNSIVKKGDTVGNYIVVRITKESVVLNDGSKDIELFVGQ